MTVEVLQKELKDRMIKNYVTDRIFHNVTQSKREIQALTDTLTQSVIQKISRKYYTKKKQSILCTKETKLISYKEKLRSVKK